MSPRVLGSGEAREGRVFPPGFFRCWALLFPSAHPAGLLSTGAPSAPSAGWDPAALFSRGTAWAGRVSAPAARPSGGCGPGPAALRGQSQGSVPGTGTPGGHTPPSAGPRCRGRVTRGGGGAAPARPHPGPPLSTCCSRAPRVAAGSPEHREPQNTQPQRHACPRSLRARHLSRSSPASCPKITINPPRAEGHLTCQSPILARIDILAAGSESPAPCWSWTARASHSPGTPVGKSSPYLSRDSLTWP